MHITATPRNFVSTPTLMPIGSFTPARSTSSDNSLSVAVGALDIFVTPSVVSAPSSSPYGISAREEAALADNDLRGFWLSRLGKDPIARVGIAFWGTDDDLRNAIESGDKEFWQPQFNWLTTFYLRLTVPSNVVIPPKTNDELFEYWRYMGNEANSRLKAQIVDSAWRSGQALTPVQVSERYREVGTSLAHAHAKAVRHDDRTHIGVTRGLLNPLQVADYHKEVFRDAGLPANTYGGTPYWFLPDVLEIFLTSGLYGTGTIRA